MSKASDIRDQIIKQLEPQLEFLKKQCEIELENIIKEKVYSRPESDWYERTGELLTSITSTDIIISGDTVSFKVYLDPKKLHHFSIAGEEAKGIAPDEEVYIPPLLNFGHKGLGVKYKATNFLDAYIKELEEDLNQVMVKYIITKYNRKSYKK